MIRNPLIRFALSLALTLIAPVNTLMAKQPLRIAITQIVPHPSLDKIRQGIIDELAAANYRDGESIIIDYKNAQGDLKIASQIAKQFAGANPKIIVAIATPSAQAVLSAIKHLDIPLVFGAVTDPVAAKLVPSLKETVHNVTGTIDLPPAQEQINLIKNMIPQAQTIGFLYNIGEPNSIKQLELLRIAAKNQALHILEIPVTKATDIPQATKQAIGSCDALFIPNDNMVISSIESVLKICHTYKIPLFTSDPDSVQKGALGAVANDQYLVGRQTGALVVKAIENKEKTLSIPVEKVKGTKTYINEKTAQYLGAIIPNQ